MKAPNSKSFTIHDLPVSERPRERFQLSDICSISRGDFIDPNYYVEKSRRAYIRIKELPAKGDINLDAIALFKSFAIFDGKRPVNTYTEYCGASQIFDI